MKTGKVQIEDKASISKALNRRNYILYIVFAAFILIDLDLFSVQPKFLETDQKFWKILTIVFQLLCIASLIKWDYTKKKIVDVLTNGMLVKGQLKFSERLRSKNTTFYIHLFEYTVSGKTYEVGYKNKSQHVNTQYIIYHLHHPKKAIVFEDLNSDVKQLIAFHL